MADFLIFSVRGVKVSEYQIIEIAENVCNLKKAEADWILQIDIVEKGDKLEVINLLNFGFWFGYQKLIVESL